MRKRRNILLVLAVIVAAFANPSIASAGYCTTHSATPTCHIVNQVGTTAENSAFDATVNVSSSTLADVTALPGKPLTWDEYNGFRWVAAEAAGEAPLLTSVGVVGWGGATLMATGAFIEGWYIGGAISKRFIFTNNSHTVATSGLVTSLPSDYAITFTACGVGSPLYPSGNPNGTVYPTGTWCTSWISSAFGGSAPYGTQYGVDTTPCVSYAINPSSNNINAGTGACTFTDDTTKSWAIEFNNVGVQLQTKGYDHYHQGPNHVGNYASTTYTMNQSEMYRFLNPKYDSSHTSAQSGDVVTTTFTPATPTNTNRSAGATKFTDPADGGDTAPVDAENCLMDATYCPGGSNYPNNMTLLKPNINETYSDYITRLQAAGFLGTINSTSEATDISGYGPQAITRIIYGTKVYDPNGWPTIAPVIDKYGTLTLRHNGTNATPQPTDGGSNTCGTSGNPCITEDNTPDPGQDTCSTCAIDWTPIEALSLGTKFPFGVPAWIEGVFSGISFSSSCPTLSIGKPSSLGGGSIGIPFCSSQWESTYRPIVFPILEALMTIAAVVFMATKILGYSGGDDE